jgi:clan AA aspartic protease
MGAVYAALTLKNGGDLAKAREGNISAKNVRTVTLTAVVDTGTTTLVIDEEICRKLGLSVVETSTINVAGGSKVECKITEPVHIQWKERQVETNAVVLPEGKIILGNIPLAFMDLIVDSARRELVGAHGDQVVLTAM